MKIDKVLSTKYVRNDQGFGLTEVLVGSVVALLVLATTAIIFTRSATILKDENDSAKIRGEGRNAVEFLAEEIRMAGFGLPPTLGITAIAASSLSFQSNLNDVRTTTPPCTACAGTVAGAAGDTTLTVIDESGFSSGDKIVIYDPNFNLSELNTVTGTASGSISLGTGLANSYIYGVNTNLVTVNKYSDVVITIAGTSITKTIDGSTTVLMDDVVPTTGLSFNYNGAATPSAVQKVGITLNFLDPDIAGTEIEFKTDVKLRNS